MIQNSTKMWDIPDYLGVPATIASVVICFVKFVFIEGLKITPENMLSGFVAIMSAIYLITKIQGQYLDNVKKKLRSETLKMKT
jgi:hypothetical protein